MGSVATGCATPGAGNRCWAVKSDPMIESGSSCDLSATGHCSRGRRTDNKSADRIGVDRGSSQAIGELDWLCRSIWDCIKRNNPGPANAHNQKRNAVCLPLRSAPVLFSIELHEGLLWVIKHGFWNERKHGLFIVCLYLLSNFRFAFVHCLFVF